MTLDIYNDQILGLEEYYSQNLKYENDPATRRHAVGSGEKFGQDFTTHETNYDRGLTFVYHITVTTTDSVITDDK